MKLGDQITYSAVLQRTWRETDDLVTWKPVPVEPRSGVVVGRRTLSTGKTVNDSEFDEWAGRSYSIRTWKRKGSVPAVLVAFDMWRAPIYVPLDAVWYAPVAIVERVMRPRLTAGAP